MAQASMIKHNLLLSYKLRTRIYVKFVGFYMDSIRNDPYFVENANIYTKSDYIYTPFVKVFQNERYEIMLKAGIDDKS